MTRKIICSDSMGVYLGTCLGLGFWSKLDPVGQTEAITFADDDEIHEAIANWEGMGSLPSDLRYLTVEVPVGNYASLEACVAAGAENWDPVLCYEEACKIREPRGTLREEVLTSQAATAMARMSPDAILPSFRGRIILKNGKHKPSP